MKNNARKKSQLPLDAACCRPLNYSRQDNNLNTERDVQQCRTYDLGVLTQKRDVLVLVHSASRRSNLAPENSNSAEEEPQVR